MSDRIELEPEDLEVYVEEPKLAAATPFELTEGEHATYLGVPDSSAELAPGTVLANQFEVVQAIGKGSMGIVYEVRDTLTKQPLALKAVWPSVLTTPRVIEAFARQVNIARRLRHPGIVAIYDIRQLESFLFFTMEHLNGKTVAKLIGMRTSFPLDEAVGVIYRVCRILEYAHGHTVHRGIYPENILITRTKRLKLLDFGIRQASHLSSDSADPAQIDKALYTAPELRQDPLLEDPRTDLYSLGVLFYRMLAGDYPRGYARLTELCPRAHVGYQNLIQKALAPMEQRFQSAREFRKELEACATG